MADYKYLSLKIINLITFWCGSKRAVLISIPCSLPAIKGTRCNAVIRVKNVRTCSFRQWWIQVVLFFLLFCLFNNISYSNNISFSDKI